MSKVMRFLATILVIAGLVALAGCSGSVTPPTTPGGVTGTTAPPDTRPILNQILDKLNALNSEMAGLKIQMAQLQNAVAMYTGITPTPIPPITTAPK